MKTLRFLVGMMLSLGSLASFSQAAETFHIHSNKELYLPGETVWFKAYLLKDNTPSTSTSLFAGLYDENGRLVEEKQFPIFSGTAEGSFLISDSTRSSLMHINLFTKSTAIENRGTTYSKSIGVYQSGKLDVYTINRNNNISVDVVVEGGTLVAQMANHLFFKAVDENGMPAYTSISVNGPGGELIDSLYTDKMGAARIQMSPDMGEQYSISWVDARGIQKKLLPQPVLESAVLHSEINAGELFYIIQTKNSIAALSTLKLLLFQGADTILAEQLNFKTTGSYIGKKSIDSMPPGLFVLKLLDSNGKTLQQKNVYITHKVSPAFKVIQQSREKKGKNIVEISMPAEGTFILSASVAIDDFNPAILQTSIVDELMLSRRQNGLARISDSYKLADQFVNIYPPQYKYIPMLENNPYLSVTINSNEAIPSNAELDLIISDRGYGKQFFKLKQTIAGFFRTADLIFFDSAKANFQVAGMPHLSTSLNLRAENSPPNLPLIKPHSNFPVQFSEGNFQIDRSLIDAATTTTKGFNSEQTIQNVIVSSKYVNPVTKRLLQLEDQYTTGMFKGMARGTQINVLDDPTAQFSDPFNYILYRAPRISVSGPFGSRSFGLMLFIDEIPSDYIQLENLQMSRVAYIKIIQGIVITASGTAPDGVLYVYTKKGNEEKTTTMKSAIVKGYDVPVSFTMPDYASPESLKLVDRRSALYWEPNIITDKNNPSFRIEYYNNDTGRKQLLTVKGFSKNGELVEFKKVIE